MKKLLLTIFLSLTAINTAFGETLELTTNIPAPINTYDRLRITPSPEKLETYCDIGSLYVNSTNNLLYICTSLDVDGEWMIFGKVWEQDGDNIYLADTITSPELKRFAIGTSTPELKLTLDDDGGIMAKDSTSALGSASYSTLPSPGQGTHLIWYPKKASFRAGRVGVGASAWDNTNIGNFSAAFGYDTTASGIASTVGGGYLNTTEANYSAVGGGEGNTVDTSSTYSAIGGGQTNQIVNSSFAFIGGGANNIMTLTPSSVILGGSDNSITSGSHNSIGGGIFNTITTSSYAAINGGRANTIIGNHSAIIGGFGNSATGLYSTIGGGENNSITGNYQTIVGGKDNSSAGLYGTIVGGENNQLSNDYSAIGGGKDNSVSGISSSIAGGENNSITGTLSFIGSGQNNSIAGTSSSIGGGENNSISVGATHNILGGQNNSIEDLALLGSTIAGGQNNITASQLSFVGGQNMKTDRNSTNTFAWGIPATLTTINSSNSFIIYSANVGIGNTNPSEKLHIDGDMLIANGALTITNPPSASGSPFIREDATGIIGNDLAETFKTNQSLEMGDVVKITSKGFAEKSIKAYENTVIGIVSYKPAVLLNGNQTILSPQLEKVSDDQSVAVALAGRVICKVSLENGPIEIGDLLTASSLEGHAMKSGNYEKSFGTVFAKALEPFHGGKDGKKNGSIKVLITVQ